MSDNTMVLPGDIPGLLRRGSPVLLPDGSSMTVHRFGDGGAWGASGFGRFVNGTLNGADMGGLRLDLTDPTGRAHAAWWFNSTSDGQNGALVRSIGVPATSLARVMRLAEAGVAMNDADTSILRDACLRLAGRTA